MSERVRVSREDGIADVRLSRADKMNAVDMDMFVALVDTGADLARDKSLRAVVLSGEGRAFCSGLDIPGLMATTGKKRTGPNLLDTNDESPANFAQRSAWVWKELPVPVIAAVHGVAYGAGIQIALAADIRFVTPDARISIRESFWGLIPDVTASQTLRQLVRLDVAKELTYTARVISGIEAHELGLMSHVSENPYDDAMALAREIAGRSPDAIRAAKKLLDEATVGSIEDGLRLEATLQRSLMGGPNQLEAVQAGMQKREPKFSDPK